MLLKRRLLNGFIFALFLSLLSISTYAELVIIVSKDNSLTSVSKSELGRLFLGKADTFINGSKATPINQVMSSETRKAFDSGILNRTESQIKAYWSKMLFSGDGAPPLEVNGDLDVLQKVMGDPSAIGYIDSSAVNEGVKVLTVN